MNNAMTQSFRELGQLKLAVMIGMALVIISFFVFLTLRVSSPVMSPVYSNISMQDSGQIVQELDKMGIPYELGTGGTQVKVPTNRVDEVRVKLAQLGLPSEGSGIGYEIFDKEEALGTSNFVLNVNKLRALEGELARTIGSLKSVESARVHLVIPKRELFTRDRRDPTASVALKMRSNTKPEKEEIAAIRHLVATAVPGLKPSKITIVDSNGSLLARGIDDENDAEYLAASAQEFRTNFERQLEGTIISLIERTVGMGKVQAEVTADIDFDRITTNSETFDPEGQVARSIQGIEENEQENERDLKDNVSVKNNLPDADAQEGALQSNRSRQRNEETTNFEISKTVENHVKESGTVNRLSVAVLVDGTYAFDESGNRIFTPLAEEELTKLETLVKSSIGYDEARGDTVEVINMAFAGTEEAVFEPGPFDWLKKDLTSIIQTLVLGGVAALVILLIIRPLVARAIASSREAQEEEEYEQSVLGGPNISGRLADLTAGEEDEEDMISIDRIDGNVKSSTLRKINELVDKHPDETLGVLRGWAFDVED